MNSTNHNQGATVGSWTLGRALTCQLTDRSSVYSFGVLLVELASARRPIETKREMKERLTARWAMAMFIGGASADVLDPHLQRTPAAERALESVLELAFRCMGPVRQDRPAMSDCCRVLWAIRKTYRDMLAADVMPQFSDRATSTTASRPAKASHGQQHAKAMARSRPKAPDQPRHKGHAHERTASSDL